MTTSQSKGSNSPTDSLRSLAAEGRILVIGFAAGGIPEVKVNRLLLNNISVVGVGLGAFYFAGNPGYMREQWDDRLPHLESGAMTPVIGETYTLDQAGDAIRPLDERRATGKIVLSVR